MHFTPDIRVSHDVKQVKEILPVCGTRVRGTTLESILPCVETPLAELVGFQYVKVGVLDVNVLTGRIHGSETSSLVLFPVLVDPSLRIFYSTVVILSMGLYLYMRVVVYCVSKARDVVRVEICTKIVLLSQSHLHCLLGTLAQNIDHHHCHHLFYAHGKVGQAGQLTNDDKAMMMIIITILST